MPCSKTNFTEVLTEKGICYTIVPNGQQTLNDLITNIPVPFLSFLLEIYQPTVIVSSLVFTFFILVVIVVL